MLEGKYVSPEFKKESFHCPRCGVYAHQEWALPFEIYKTPYERLEQKRLIIGLDIASCHHCQRISVWYNGKMVAPNVGGVSNPNDDLSDEIKEIYFEARDILNKSPRGSAALLRTALELLCHQLGEKDRDINKNIANLVKNGLPEEIQQALDYVRIIGNKAVHPGVIDLKDNVEIAQTLFSLINIIADRLITQKKEIKQFYDTLPDTYKDTIAKRDGKK